MQHVQGPARQAGRRRQEVTLSLAALLASLGTSIANVALPALATDFAAPYAELQWVVVAYLGSMTATALLAGSLGDRHGLKSMLVAGLALFGGASLLCAIARNVPLLVAARVLQGAGAGFMVVLSTALMRELSRDDRVGRAMGVLGTVSAIGTALGPSLGGLLLALTGWRGVFLLQVPFATVALVLAVAMLPRVPARAQGTPTARVLPDARASAYLGINLLVAAVMMTTHVVGPFYLSGGLGLASVTVGAVMSVGPLVSIATGAPSGRLVDAWGARRAMLVGLGLLALGTLSLALLPPALGLAAYLFAIAVLTPGYQLFQAANNTAIFAGIPKEGRGSASGWITLSRNLGLMAGGSLMGSVFAHAVGTEDTAHAAAGAVAGGMQFTFLLLGVALLLVLGIAGAHAVGATRSAAPREPVG